MSVWQQAKAASVKLAREPSEHDRDLARGIEDALWNPTRDLKGQIELLKREVAELVRWRQSQESK